MHGASRTVGLCLAAAVLLVAAEPREARAQATTARDEARVLANAGLEAFEAGRFDEAIDRLRRAETKFHAPPHLLYLARAHANRRELLRARAYYEQLVAERLPEDAPAAFASAQKEARLELDALVASIPTLRVRITGTTDPAVVVTVDGRPVPVDAPFAVDPGPRAVQARLGTQVVARSVTVGLRPETVELDLKAIEAEQGRTLRAAAFVALALGGLGATIGTSAAVAAASEDDPLPVCPDPAAPEPGCSPTPTSPSRTGTLAAAGIVVGGVGLATGGVMLLVDHRQRGGASRSPALRVDAMGGGLRLSGRF